MTLELSFTCTGVTAPRHAATPVLRFVLRVTERSGVPVKAIALRCQVRIEPVRRSYTSVEEERLLELFGMPHQWRDTLQAMQFANVGLMVQGFTGETTVDLDVPITYDFEVASAKYFHALEAGEVPFLLLFSGTAFTVTGGRFEVAPVDWSAEASIRMPIAVWQEAMNAFFPGEGYLRLHRDTIDALQRYKAARALPGWDATIASLLDAAADRSEP